MKEMPRIRGKVGQIETPIEDKDKWVFTVWLTAFGEGEGKELTTQGPFETEKEALQELKKCARKITEFYQKEYIGEISGKYLDMKTNEMRDWDEN